MPLNKERPRQRRRGYPIRCYVGANGSGKSLAMVHDILPSLANGRKVLSTVKILDPLTGEPHPLYIPFVEFSQLLDFRNGDVLMDEVTGIASSRASMSLPKPVANFLNQLRRADITLSWTSPSWKRADTIIRETTQALTLCRGYFPKEASDGDKLWKENRGFKWTTFDANEFEDWTLAKTEKLKPLIRDYFWRPNSPAEASYDTYDSVNSLGAPTDESGNCVVCGRRRTAPKCTCPPTSSETPSTAILSLDGVSPVGS